MTICNHVLISFMGQRLKCLNSILGNKCDLPAGQRKVKAKEAQKQHTEVPFFETSAKNSTNVSDAFQLIAGAAMTRAATAKQDQYVPSTTHTVNLNSASTTPAVQVSDCACWASNFLHATG